MYVKDLKDLVRHESYVVDPELVAVAVLRRAAERHMGRPAITRRGARGRATFADRRRRWR